MSDIRLKSADLIHTPDPNEPLIRTLVIDIQGSNGKIFCLLRILGKTNEDRERIGEVIFGHLKRFQSTLNEKVNVPRRFEQVLQAINEDVYKTYSEGKKIPLSDFHCVLGVLHNNQIFLSGVGSLLALFMHRTVKQRYVLYELDKQFRSEDGDSWEKLFVTVLDGELTKGDIFYLATRASTNDISVSDLQDTLVTLPPPGALQRIQQHLKRDTAYGALCLRIADERIQGAPKKTNPMTSIEQLGQTKEDTATLLGEQSPDLSGFLSKITTPLLQKLSSPGTKGFKSTIKLILRSVIKIGVIFIGVVGKFLKLIIGVISKIINKLMPLIKNQTRRRSTTDSIKKKAKNINAKLKSLPKSSKYIAASLLIIIIIISGVLKYNSKQQTKQQEEEAAQSIITNIEEKRDAAEASLIYDDADQARTLLNEAVALIEMISPNTKNYDQIISELRTSIDGVYTGIRGVTLIEPDVLARLADQNTTSRFTTTVNAGGVIYGVTDALELYRFRELEQDLLKEENTNGSIGKILIATGKDNGFYFVDDNQRLGRANVTVNTLNPTVSGIEKLQSVEDIIVYNNNLYALSAKGQQIIKMRPQGDGFDGGTSWITSNNTSLSEAKSITIDGDIYILTQTGIIKFTSGKEQVFDLSSIDPVLANPTKIWTDVGVNFLYVLDPAENRIVVYDKSGSFVTQYVSPMFASAQNMFIREDKKQIIIGTDSEFLGFSATHLLQ